MGEMLSTNSEKFKSSVAIKYPKHRDDILTTVETWLHDKRNDDGAEGLWRIHDELYDLSSFIDKHPGGPDWLKVTKGTDITEAFESHHISTLAEEMLPKFYVRKAKSPRNYHTSFHENGFYKTLKTKVREILKDAPEAPKQKTKIMADGLLLGYIVSAFLSVVLKSFTLGALSGAFLAMLTIAAHNFFHTRDNFRMFYFDFSLMSSREWRISHALSHHLYTNTISDLEMTILEPFLEYLPREKHIVRRTVSWIISPIIYAFMFIMDYTKRFIAFFTGKGAHIGKRELLPLLIPICMYIISGNIMNTLFLWLWIIFIASFHFGLVGLNAAHHHPNIFHDGDTRRPDRDWGLLQMDSVMDRHEINNSSFLVLTNFGDHALHHLFPTVDHGLLPYLYPALKETCEQFNVQFRVVSQLDLVKGQFLQLFRVRPNPNIPGTKREMKKEKSLFERYKPYINVSAKDLKT